MTTPRIALIIGTTRASRWADVPAAWLLKNATELRPDLSFELVDLKDFDLPLFDEPASNLWAPSSNAAAIAWQEKLAGFDGYIFLTAEYNHSISGALKNAIDQAGKEWIRKPMTAFGYGSMGAARAVEHLRHIAVEMQMAPVRGALHLGGADFFTAHPMGGGQGLEAVEENLLPSLKSMLDDFAWWVEATRAARSQDAARAA